MRLKINRIVPALILSVLVLMLASCAEKIVGSRPAATGNIRIKMDLAPSLRPALGVASYLLTVTGSDMDTVVALLAIDDSGGALVGDSVAIPLGVNRKFDLRGVNIMPFYENDSLRYDTTDVVRGETTADVVPGAPIILNMTLVPVAPIFYFSPRYQVADWNTQFEVNLKMFNIDSVAEIEAELAAYDMHGTRVLLVDSMLPGSDVNPDIPLEWQGGWFLFHQDTALANRTLLFPQNKGGEFIRAFMTIRYDQLAIPVDTVQLQLFLYGVTRVDKKALPRQPIYVDNARVEVRRTAGVVAVRALPDAGKEE